MSKGFGFTFQDISGEDPEKNRVRPARILANTVHKSMLCKTTRQIAVQVYPIPVKVSPFLIAYHLLKLSISKTVYYSKKSKGNNGVCRNKYGFYF